MLENNTHVTGGEPEDIRTGDNLLTEIRQQGRL